LRLFPRALAEWCGLWIRAISAPVLKRLLHLLRGGLTLVPDGVHEFQFARASGKVFVARSDFFMGSPLGGWFSFVKAILLRGAHRVTQIMMQCHAQAKKRNGAAPRTTQSTK
jgi:hypothetical protein